MCDHLLMLDADPWDGELLPAAGLVTSSEEYYPTVAINALVRSLRETALSSQQFEVRLNLNNTTHSSRRDGEVLYPVNGCCWKRRVPRLQLSRMGQQHCLPTEGKRARGHGCDDEMLGN